MMISISISISVFIYIYMYVLCSKHPTSGRNTCLLVEDSIIDCWCFFFVCVCVFHRIIEIAVSSLVTVSLVGFGFTDQGGSRKH